MLRMKLAFREYFAMSDAYVSAAAVYAVSFEFGLVKL